MNHARISGGHRSQQPWYPVVCFIPITIQHPECYLLCLPCLAIFHFVKEDFFHHANDALNLHCGPRKYGVGKPIGDELGGKLPVVWVCIFTIHLLATTHVSLYTTHYMPTWSSFEWSCPHNPWTSILRTFDRVALFYIRVHHRVRTKMLNRELLDPYLQLQEGAKLRTGSNPVCCMIHITV